MSLRWRPGGGKRAAIVNLRNPGERDAYIQGARDAMESMALTGNAPGLRMLESWIAELEEWTTGEPPPPPYQWE